MTTKKRLAEQKLAILTNANKVLVLLSNRLTNIPGQFVTQLLTQLRLQRGQPRLLSADGEKRHHKHKHESDNS